MFKGILNKGFVRYSLVAFVLILCVVSMALYAPSISGNVSDTGLTSNGNSVNPEVEVMDFYETGSPNNEGLQAPPQPSPNPSDGGDTDSANPDDPGESSRGFSPEFGFGGSPGGGGIGPIVQCIPTPKHRVCDYNQRACVLVDGAGADQCSNFDDCVHSECRDWSCVIIDSKGDDTCATDQDCRQDCIPPYLQIGKTALPSEATCVDVAINLKVEGKGDTCGEYYPIDVVLVFDKSGSMDDDGWDGTISDWQPIGDAKIAAKIFAGLLKANDKAGLVSFSTVATLDQALTFDKQAVKDKISAMNAGGWTNMSHALELANAELTGNGRPEVKWIEVLLSDGNNNCGMNNPPSDCHDRVFARANEAKNAGITIYTIALGETANQTLMEHVANITGGDYYYAPDSGDLQAIYEDIAQHVTTIAGSDVFVYDYLPAYVDLNQSTLPPECSYNSTVRKITCSLGIISINETADLQFDVYVNQLGYNLTNVYPDSGVSYRDYNGSNQFLPFPETYVTVHGFEGADEICNDTYDNDCDGYIDWEDPDCRHDICDYNAFTCDNVPENVSGDACEADSDCYHMACAGMACAQVAGEGEDTCAEDADCYYMRCDYGQLACAPTTGNQTDECNTWNDCQFCGNGMVDGSEDCELPSTLNNAYCIQTSQQCNGTKLGTRDALGNCGASCGCDYDPFTYACVKGQCGATCAVNGDCNASTCSQTYNDYCSGKKLTEYDSDKIMDSTNVTNSTANTCLDGCECTENSVTCNPPQTHTYCVKGICDAQCDSDDDCADYCDGSIKHTGRTCGWCSTCMCSAGTMLNCNSLDGWYNTSETQWVDNGMCKEKEQKRQEYRDYNCGTSPAVDCYYSVTNTTWINTGATRNKENGTSCNDDLWCTDNDVCTAGTCGGSERDCSDETACTHDSCDEINDMCSHTPDDTECDDGLWCNGQETCDTELGCVGGTLVDCSQYDIDEIATCFNNPDSINFTWDYGAGFISQCNEATDSCTQGSQTLNHTCSVDLCGAECDAQHPCENNSCSDTYNDSCDGKKLVEYDSDKIKDSTNVNDSCENSCEEDCECTDCYTDCSPPETNSYCVKGVCDAACDSNDDCTCQQDGCIGKDYYDYPAQGACNDGCSCEQGACNPSISYNDPRCSHKICDYVNQTCAVVEGNGTNQCNTWQDCQFCGNGNVEIDEQCELPSTFDNSYCSQQTTECNGTKLGTRDGLGNCGASCGCEYDPFTYACVKGQCGASCAVNGDCAASNCSQTYNDYCNGTKLVEYDSDKVKDSTNVSNSTANTCLDACSCTNNSVSCNPPSKNSYCVKGICNATCAVNGDCDDGNQHTIDTCNLETCGCQHETVPYCGDGNVSQSEQCELPNTFNNIFCSQSTSECAETGHKLGTRDAKGNCSAACGCDYDPFSYACVKGQCGATCAVNGDCNASTCSQTYNDYCSGKKLTEYDSDKIMDSTNVTNSTANTCLGSCLCTGNPVTCNPPSTNTYCVKGVCNASCAVNSDCDDGNVHTLDTCDVSNCSCKHQLIPYCGDGNVNASTGEQCELPSTLNNAYCIQTASQCNGTKLGTRDALGNCGASCGCEYDPFTYACVKGQCGAECDSNDDCTCQQDHCEGIDWYDYPDQGTCSGDCACSGCEPVVSECDPRCMGNCEVNVWVGHDMNPSWGYPYAATDDIYIIAEDASNGACNGLDIPITYFWCTCPDKDPEQIAIEAMQNDWAAKYDRLCSADAAYHDGNNNPTHSLECGNCQIRRYHAVFPEANGKKFWTGVGSCQGTFQVDIPDDPDCYTRVSILDQYKALALGCAGQCEDQPVLQHAECRDMKCTKVDGYGSDQCSQDSDCYYYGCDYSSMMCIEKAGSQADECSAWSDCTHNVCNYQTMSCELSNSPGTDECSTLIDCINNIEYHYECTSHFTCEAVLGPGVNECASLLDCITIPLEPEPPLDNPDPPLPNSA